MLIKVDLILKEKSYKRNLIRFKDYNSSKLVFILLTKVIELYIGPIIIDIRWFGFKKFFPNFFFWYLSLKNGLNDLLQVLFNISDNINRNLKK